MNDGAGERRLAGAEIAPQRDDVAGPRRKRDILGEADKLALAGCRGLMGSVIGGSHYAAVPPVDSGRTRPC